MPSRVRPTRAKTARASKVPTAQDVLGVYLHRPPADMPFVYVKLARQMLSEESKGFFAESCVRDIWGGRRWRSHIEAAKAPKTQFQEGPAMAHTDDSATEHTDDSAAATEQANVCDVCDIWQTATEATEEAFLPFVLGREDGGATPTVDGDWICGDLDVRSFFPSLPDANL